MQYIWKTTSAFLETFQPISFAFERFSVLFSLLNIDKQKGIGFPYWLSYETELAAFLTCSVMNETNYLWSRLFKKVFLSMTCFPQFLINYYSYCVVISLFSLLNE